MSDIAVRVEHLSKMYRLGVINSGTLFKDIQTWIALKRGKEDPHSKIGGNKYSGDKDHFWALKDVSLDIKQGDRVGIIGKNGAGKSTLLKILSRITTPTEGTIKVKGKIASLLEVGTGFHGELTGRENIYLNGAILGMKKRRITEKLDGIIAFSGIEKYIDTPVKRYSSGMYVRLAFAVAAHLDSDILIADEVLAVGDAEFQKKALGKMQDLSTGEGRTVLFVSHNMAAVKNLCNCGVYLENGQAETNIENIDITIPRYLGVPDQGETNSCSHEWKNNGEFSNPEFMPITLKVLNNANSSNISAEEKISFRFEYRIEVPSNYLEFNFILKSGPEVIFWFSPFESIEMYQPGQGDNVLDFSFPKNLLNSRQYSLEVQASIHNSYFIVDNLKGIAPKVFFTTEKSIFYRFPDVENTSLILPKIEYKVY